jgi:hypothetical protein
MITEVEISFAWRRPIEKIKLLKQGMQQVTVIFETLFFETLLFYLLEEFSLLCSAG